MLGEPDGESWTSSGTPAILGSIAKSPDPSLVSLGTRGFWEWWWPSLWSSHLFALVRRLDGHLWLFIPPCDLGERASGSFFFKNGRWPWIKTKYRSKILSLRLCHDTTFIWPCCYCVSGAESCDDQPWNRCRWLPLRSLAPIWMLPPSTSCSEATGSGSSSQGWWWWSWWIILEMNWA